MIAVVFPGQGSQSPGMGKALFDTIPAAREVFDRVGSAVGRDVAALCFDSDEETLRQTENAQIALFAVSLAAYEAWKTQGGRADVMAGHSVGEYAALAASGVYSLEDAARLVQTRGKVMAAAGKAAPGTMAAVLGLERELLEAACKEAGGIVVVANDNCPGQLVISGETEAVARAGELAKAKGAKRVVPLNVSGAFHSPLMEGPAAAMAEALSKVTPRQGSVPVVSNVTAEPVFDAGQWPSLLERQLRSPVRWTESIQRMRQDGATTFVECGSGEVLSGLIRRIDKEAKTVRVSDPASLEHAIGEVQ